jgi:hypothetical protein
MVQEITLNLFLILFLFAVFIESQFVWQQKGMGEIRLYLKTVPATKILLYFLSLGCLISLLLLKGHQTILSLYIYSALSMLILFHAQWLSQNKRKGFVFFLFVGIILGRIFYPADITHDVFIIAIASWLGPFLSMFRFFTRKIFVIISLAWFIYDVFYIWITHASSAVVFSTQAVGFPLALVVHNTSIGLADLFYASLLISIVKNKTFKLLAIVLLIGTNIGLTFFAYTIHSIKIFPLLVIWVPCGILAVIAETQGEQKNIR